MSRLSQARVAIVLWGVLWGVLPAPSGLAADANPGDPVTVDAMEDIVQALRTVFPLSVNDSRFAAPEHGDAVRRALAKLSSSSARLEEHGRDLDPSFAYLSRSLAQDLRDVERRFASGQIRTARFMLQNSVETCVTCHSRLPSGPTPQLGTRFLETVDLAALPLDEQARLKAAVRQFGAAMKSYEKLFASSQQSPSDHDLSGDFASYLEICVRVEGEIERARNTFSRLALRDDLSKSLRAKIGSWINSLATLADHPVRAGKLETARNLLREAEKLSSDWSDSRGLVYYLAASGDLHKFIDSESELGVEVAEAYYLLGLIESRVGHSAWLSQAEVLLESAIRMAPGAEFANEALTLLEQLLVSGYTGSSGEPIPSEIRELLDELGGLVRPHAADRTAAGNQAASTRSRGDEP